MDDFVILKTERKHENGWDIRIDYTNYKDVRTGATVTIDEYTCIHCGYKTGTQAKDFYCCPMCGQPKDLNKKRLEIAWS